MWCVVWCRLVEGESLMDYVDRVTANTSAKQRVDIVAATLRKVLLVSPTALMAQPHITTSPLNTPAPTTWLVNVSAMITTSVSSLLCAFGVCVWGRDAMPITARECWASVCLCVLGCGCEHSMAQGLTPLLPCAGFVADAQQAAAHVW